MADKKRNTTQKNPITKDIVEEGYPRCKICFSRLSVLEDMYGHQKLWCFHCESPLLNSQVNNQR